MEPISPYAETKLALGQLCNELNYFSDKYENMLLERSRGIVPRLFQNSRRLENFPMNWFRRAARAKGRTLDVGIYLWNMAAEINSASMQVPINDIAEWIGCDRSTVSRALKALRKKKLIRLTTPPGSKTKVTILAVKEEIDLLKMTEDIRTL